jgi:hypothetical protein
MRSLLSHSHHGASAPAALDGRLHIAHVAFLLLFPGFFFYQTLLGLGLINSVLGGYFSEIIVIVIVPLLITYGKKLKGYRLTSRVDLYFAIFILYFLAIIAANFLSGANITTILNHLRAIGYYVALFIIFKTINLEHRLFKLLLIFSLIAMAGIIFNYSVEGTFYLAPQHLGQDSDNVATYQGFSRSYFITLIVVVSFIKRPHYRAIIYCLAGPALYVNGARSEFVAMLFMLPIIEIYRSKHKLHALAVIVAIVAIAAMNFDSIVSVLPSNRMLELLDLSQSTSANARHELNNQAVVTIEANPILGDYASYPPGDYAHNVLSAWVDLGLFGFIFLLALLIVPAVLLIPQGLFGMTISNEYLLAFCLLSVTIFLLFTSHNFTDMTTGAALGAYSNYRSRRTP